MEGEQLLLLDSEFHLPTEKNKTPKITKDNIKTISSMDNNKICMVDQIFRSNTFLKRNLDRISAERQKMTAVSSGPLW